MAKKNYKKKAYEKHVGFGTYFLVGILVTVFSFVALLPLNFITILVAMFADAILLAVVLLTYIILAIMITGWVVIKVVQSQGWKRVK